MVELEKAHEEFVADLKIKDRSPSTIVAYAKDIEQLVAFAKELKKMRVEEIGFDDLKGFLDRLESQNYTKKSISRKINSTKTFFRFLVTQEYITDNPAALVSHPKIELKPPRILSQMEYRALRDAVRNDPRMRAIVELLLQTGIRIGELRRLTVDDINDKNGEIRIDAYGKHKERRIPINTAAQRALKGYLNERPQTDNRTVFLTKTGRPFLIRNVRASLNRYFKKAGVKDVTVNALRHTFVAQHLMRGASITLVSKIAGHKRLSTTEKYLAHIERAENEKETLEEL